MTSTATQPNPDAPVGASPQDSADSNEPRILSPNAASKPKGNARPPGCRVEKPGMAHLNVANTKLLAKVAHARGLSSSTPPAVQVARHGMDVYYLIPVELLDHEVSEVKYGSANSTCRVDLYPYLEQSKLIVPQEVHWFVPARFANTSKYGAIPPPRLQPAGESPDREAGPAEDEGAVQSRGARVRRPTAASAH